MMDVHQSQGGKAVSRHMLRLTIVFGAVALLGGACAAKPSQRPIYTGSIDTGPGSLEAVRRQLAGTWMLVSYETFNEAGEAVVMPASGRLTYDQFGNLTVRGRIEREAATIAGVAGELLNVTGRVAIDTAQRRFLVRDVESNVDFDEAELAAASPDNFRYYEFVENRLILIVKNAAGDTTARLTWEK